MNGRGEAGDQDGRGGAAGVGAGEHGQMLEVEVLLLEGVPHRLLHDVAGNGPVQQERLDQGAGAGAVAELSAGPVPESLMIGGERARGAR